MPSGGQRRARRRVLAGAVVVLLVVGVWTLVAGLRARTHLERARDDLAAVRAHPSDDPARLRVRLGRDLREARRARSLMHQPGPLVVGWVPVLGRTVRAERAVADAAVAVLDAAGTVAADASALGSADGVDLDRVRHLERDLARAADRSKRPLHDLATQPTGLTPGFVRRQVQFARASLVPLGARLGDTARLVHSVGALFGADGPRTVLVGLANNAELRGTGGLVSSVALGRGHDGHLSIGAFRDVRDVADPPGKARAVPAPASYLAQFGAFKANTTIWKNATMSPAGPTTMQVLAELAAVSLRQRPDIVVLLDVPAMAGIVGSTGRPLRLPDGEQVAGDELAHALMVESYGAATSDAAVQSARRHALQQAAGAAFRSIASTPPTLGLVRALASAAGGRHLMLWSDRPDEQAGFVAAGAAGAVDPDGADAAMVTVNNLGDSAGNGNKLDYYAQRQLDVSVVVDRGVARVRQQLTIRNAAPDGVGPYVAGEAHPGRLQELLDLAVAGDAALQGFTRDGAPEGARLLRADGTRRLTTAFTLDRGRSTTLVVSYEVPLPDDVYRLRLIPQPLAHPARISVDIRAAPDLVLHGLGSTVVRAGEVRRAADWTGQTTIAVRVGETGGWRARLARFWSSKVSIG